MNKKGFTLIELLAVIIILGILMIIAIPSVTKYISDSRKSSYIDTAKELIGSARNVVNEGKLEMYDTDATYYLDIACLKTENAMKSPYGEFVKDGAYVVVTYDGKGYTYYWTSIDEAGEGIPNITRIDKLDEDDIESDLKVSDIRTDIGIDGRSKTIVVSKSNNCQKEGSNPARSQINGETGERIKTKRTITNIHVSTRWLDDAASFGSEINMHADVDINDYAQYDYEFQWQIKYKGTDEWVDIEGANSIDYVTRLTINNYMHSWRATINIYE